MRRVFAHCLVLSAAIAMWPVLALAAEWVTTQAQAPIPEPGTGSLVLAGVLGVLGVVRRRIFKG